MGRSPALRSQLNERGPQTQGTNAANSMSVGRKNHAAAFAGAILVPCAVMVFAVHPFGVFWFVPPFGSVLKN